MTPNRKEIISLLSDIRTYIGKTHLHSADVALITSTCRFINSSFCNCRYVEYWVLDLRFGQHTTQTEMGAELKGIDTIEKFVDFLYGKRGEYMATFDADNPNPYQLG